MHCLQTPACTSLYLCIVFRLQHSQFFDQCIVFRLQLAHFLISALFSDSSLHTFGSVHCLQTPAFTSLYLCIVFRLQHSQFFDQCIVFRLQLAYFWIGALPSDSSLHTFGSVHCFQTPACILLDQCIVFRLQLAYFWIGALFSEPAITFFLIGVLSSDSSFHNFGPVFRPIVSQIWICVLF